MPLSKVITTPTGVSVLFHKAMQATVDIEAGTLSLNVASWASVADYLAGAGLVWMWPLDLPVGALDDVDAAVALVAPFDGATTLPDPAVTLPSVRARTWARIRDARDAAIYAGLYAHMGLAEEVSEGLAQVSGDPGAALGAWVVANLNAATALRTQINASTDIAALGALSFPILP